MTAENALFSSAPGAVLTASMRPRPMTAENMHRRRLQRQGAGASMRPRPMTAENMNATFQNGVMVSLQ